MTAIAWAIVFAVIEIFGVVEDNDRPKPPGFRAFSTIMSLCALAMVIVCTVKEWR